MTHSGIPTSTWDSPVWRHSRTAVVNDDLGEIHVQLPCHRLQADKGKFIVTSFRESPRKNQTNLHLLSLRLKKLKLCTFTNRLLKQWVIFPWQSRYFGIKVTFLEKCLFQTYVFRGFPRCLHSTQQTDWKPSEHPADWDRYLEEHSMKSLKIKHNTHWRIRVEILKVKLPRSIISHVCQKTGSKTQSKG